VAERSRGALSAFHATLRRGARLRWPAAGLAPTDAIDVEPGAGDLLLLSRAPATRFLAREPRHESLLIELRTPLADSAAGALRWGRIVYRAGTERLCYQATRAQGTLTLVDAGIDHYAIDALLSLLTPELDAEGLGAYHLAGRVTVRAPAPSP
jgi:hypothetical protein